MARFRPLPPKATHEKIAIPEAGANDGRLRVPKGKTNDSVRLA